MKRIIKKDWGWLEWSDREHIYIERIPTKFTRKRLLFDFNLFKASVEQKRIRVLTRLGGRTMLRSLQETEMETKSAEQNFRKKAPCRLIQWGTREREWYMREEIKEETGVNFWGEFSTWKMFVFILSCGWFGQNLKWIITNFIF